MNHIVFCIISQTGAGDDTVYLEPSLNLPHCSRVHSEKEGRKQASKEVSPSHGRGRTTEEVRTTGVGEHLSFIHATCLPTLLLNVKDTSRFRDLGQYMHAPPKDSEESGQATCACSTRVKFKFKVDTTMVPPEQFSEQVW